MTSYSSYNTILLESGFESIAEQGLVAKELNNKSSASSSSSY